MSIHDEAKAQFIEGYGLFSEHAGQPWLPLPSVTVCMDIAEYRALAGHLAPYALRQLPHKYSSILTDFKAEGIAGRPAVSATLHWDGNPQFVKDGNFYNTGANIAYRCGRGLRGTTDTANAGTFCGNWAQAEKTKKLPIIVIGIDGKPYELTTTRSYIELIDKFVAQIAGEVKEPAGRAEQILDLSRLQPYYYLLQVAAPHLKANDILLGCMLGKYDPSLIDSFLKFLVEGPYESELDIHQLFRKFSGDV